MSNKENEIVMNETISEKETVAEATEEAVEGVTQEKTEEAVERPYTLRKLKDGDLWTVLNIITTVFPDDLANVFAQIATKEKKVAEIGAAVTMRLVVAILKNINKIHDELYAFLEDVSGIPAKDIEEMEFGTTPMMIWDIVGDTKNAGFFKVVSKLQ